MVDTVCFTGHRPSKLKRYDTSWIEARLSDAVIRAADKGVHTFISGGALGIDQWAMEIVLVIRGRGLPIELVVARPFPSQDAVWLKDMKLHYAGLLAQANKVVDVSPDPYTPGKMHARNRWMVDHSDALIAVWNGSDGGTASTVRYAESKGKPVLLIDPALQLMAWRR